MNNFYCYNPTKILFGKKMIEWIPAELTGSSRILLLFGQGSIKRNGVYDQVVAALVGREVFEFGGIEPNPEYETCLKALRYARENSVDCILAVGGGSVIDAAKFIALAFRFEGETPWQILIREAAPPAQMLPIGCVLTLPASGSEMNNAFVLSRRKTKSKLPFFHIALYPRFSVLDPETTYTLSPHQTALGLVDMFVHVLEQYVTYPASGLLQDRQAEAILCTIIEIAEPLLAKPQDYDLRATAMWCGTQALNGTINRGLPTDWSTHGIGHELTAQFDIPHAQTLAIALGGVYRHQLSKKLAKLAQFGRRVWQLSGTDADVACRSIERTEDFFERLGVATRFSTIGLDAQAVANEICAHLSSAPFQNLGEHRNIDIAAIGAIIRSQA